MSIGKRQEFQGKTWPEGVGMAKGESMGATLQRLRQGAGLSQPALARAAGIPVGTLRNWEQDLRVPRLDVAVKLANALGCTLDELAGRVPLPEAPPADQPKKPRKGRGK
jgi:transcriptional regulator with XRE-family HTH domain